MNERNFEYRGLQLSNRQNPYRFQIIEVENEIVYNSQIFDSKNTEGVYSTNVVTGARYFKFKGIIYGNKEERELAYTKLKNIIKAEDFPSIYNRGFYPLRWTDKRGKNVRIEAKVYQPLKTTEGKQNTLDFEFTLLADNPLYQSQEEFTIEGGLGRRGGNRLGNKLGNQLNGVSTSLIINNEGDRASPIYIKIVGELEKPRITNPATGQTLKILTNTTSLVIDNRTRPFIITNEGVNIKEYKKGEYIYLAPGINHILVSNEVSLGGKVAITIKYRFTYE